MKKIYKLPLKERFAGSDHFSRAKLMHVDEVGLYFYYSSHKTPEEEITPELIRRHMIGRRDTYAVIEANNPLHALVIFHREFEGARVGGSASKMHKALWIDTENKQIKEMPFCARLNKESKYSHYICGEEEKDEDGGYLNGNGEWGMCILEGYDAPSGCPINQFYKDKYNKQHVEEFTLAGYRFIKSIRTTEIIEEDED